MSRFAIAALCLALVGCYERQVLDNTLIVYTDPSTGCQYLGTVPLNSAQALTPRMRADGTQVCREPPGVEKLP